MKGSGWALEETLDTKYFIIERNTNFQGLKQYWQKFGCSAKRILKLHMGQNVASLAK